MVSIVVKDGQIMVTGGDPDVIELIEQHSPIERAFESIFWDIHCHPDGTKLNCYGRIVGRKDDYKIRWDEVEVAC